MNAPQDTSGSQNKVTTIYERVGGYQFFVELVERFYQFVEADVSLRPLYPEDLEPGKAHLAAFLAQYWGGHANIHWSGAILGFVSVICHFPSARKRGIHG